MDWKELENTVEAKVKEIVVILCEYHQGKCSNCQCLQVCNGIDSTEGMDNAAKKFTEKVVLQTWRKEA